MVNSSLNISLHYQYNCPVLIEQAGLPPGALWWANVTNASGTESFFSRGSTVNWTAFPGTYLLTTGTASPGYRSAASPLRLQLGPSGYRGNASFIRAEYRINFTASGLPTGTAWTLNLTVPNGSVQRYTLAGPTFSLLGPGGTYQFVVGAAGYTASPDSGFVILGPQNASQALRFQPVRARASFGESGLAQGVRWWVNLTASNGSSVSGASTGSWVNFSLPTGTFSFSVAAGGWAASPASGAFTLTGSGYGRTIAFSAATPGVLSLRVRPVGARVTVGGRSITLSANGTALLALGPGIYPIEALAAGFTAYFTNVSIAAGAAANLTIGLVSLPGPPSAIPFNYVGPLATILIGVLLAVAVILAAALARAWRRRPPPSTEPPEPDVDEDLSETWLGETEDLPP